MPEQKAEEKGARSREGTGDEGTEGITGIEVLDSTGAARLGSWGAEVEAGVGTFGRLRSRFGDIFENECSSKTV